MLAADDPELRVSLTFIKIIIIKGIKNVNVCRPYMFCQDKNISLFQCLDGLEDYCPAAVSTLRQLNEKAKQIQSGKLSISNNLKRHSCDNQGIRQV